MPTTATVEYQLWQAWTIADAIGALVAGAKNVSDDKIFTMAFYGYDLAIGERLLHSTHLDAMCSIYNYDRASRNVSGPFVPVILMDALTAVGKMGCIEDDTRTKFGEPSCPEGPCVPLERTGAVIRRNQLTAALHGSGIYLAVRADTFSRFSSACHRCCLTLLTRKYHLSGLGIRASLGIFQDLGEPFVYRDDLGQHHSCQQDHWAAGVTRASAPRGRSGSGGGRVRPFDIRQDEKLRLHVR